MPSYGCSKNGRNSRMWLRNIANPLILSFQNARKARNKSSPRLEKFPTLKSFIGNSLSLCKKLEKIGNPQYLFSSSFLHQSQEKFLRKVVKFPSKEFNPKIFLEKMNLRTTKQAFRPTSSKRKWTFPQLLSTRKWLTLTSRKWGGNLIKSNESSKKREIVSKSRKTLPSLWEKNSSRVFTSPSLCII